VGRQSVFAGGAVAPGGWDRDLFSIYEYRRWRPTVALEFYHQKRHSARGDSSEARDLMVTGVDYNLSQIVLAVRGRVGDHGQLEASGTYDRYDASVASDAFEPRADGRPGFQRVRQKPFGYTYLNGLGLGLTYRFESVARRRDQEINPRSGRRFYVRYDRAFNYFIRGFNPNASFLQEEYLHLFYHQLTADWNEYVALPWSSTLGLRFAGGWLASRAVDDQQLVGNFFDYHLGGLPYMKGYTFYSLEGRKAAMAGATLRFPLLPDVGRRCLHLYLDKLYGAVYGDVGKAWDGDWDTPDPLTGRRGPRRDLGGQLRLDLVSYYSMPTRVQADLAYGVDEVAGRSPWKFYLTVLFGYL
jgi:outer membrane protein assembly factor BamA